MTSALRFSRTACHAVFWASVASLLVGCATPSAPVSKSVYDFGGFSAQPAGDATTTGAAPLALADMQTPSDHIGTAMQYRLAYAHPQTLMPYTQARWSMAPAQLVMQRVRSVLSRQRPVVALGDSTTDHALQLSLEAFEQRFDTPQSSQGAVHLRATLFKLDRVLAQRDFTAIAPARTPDAPGGAQALNMATQAVATELARWVADNVQ